VLVVSYTAVSPLPVLADRRFVFCGTVPRVTPGGCYPPPRPVEPGLSSATPYPQFAGRCADATVRPTRPPYAKSIGISGQVTVGGKRAQRLVPVPVVIDPAD
jgi:hypothetical protein